MGRLLSDDELEQLSIGPRARIDAAVRAGNAATAQAELEAYEGQLTGQFERYTDWVTTIFDVVRERHGTPGLRLLVSETGRLAALIPTSPPPAAASAAADVRPASIAAELADLMTRPVDGHVDEDALTTLLDRTEQAWMRCIDHYRDWISTLLSAAYRRYGIAELEHLHRRRGEVALATLMGDVDRDPVQRLTSLVGVLHGHFTELTVSESDDAFTIDQHPCGTCTRQVLQGRHEPPLSLAVVTDPSPATWGGRPTTVYRTHVPMWHVEMAREQVGAPWPVNQCPTGLGTGPCRIVLFKDPRDPRADALVPAAAPMSKGSAS